MMFEVCCRTLVFTPLRRRRPGPLNKRAAKVRHIAEAEALRDVVHRESGVSQQLRRMLATSRIKQHLKRGAFVV